MSKEMHINDLKRMLCIAYNGGVFAEREMKRINPEGNAPTAWQNEPQEQLPHIVQQLLREAIADSVSTLPAMRSNAGKK